MCIQLYMLKSWPKQVKMVESLRHSVIYVEKRSRGVYRSSRVQHGTYTYPNCHETRLAYAGYTYRPFACLGLLRHVSAWDV